MARIFLCEDTLSISPIIRHFEALGRIPVPMVDVTEEFRKKILHAGLRIQGRKSSG